MLLFDIRIDDSHAGFIAAMNRMLESLPDKPYTPQFGHVCSSEWWASFDRGELPVEVRSGVVSWVGPKFDPSSDEQQDVVEFVCDGKVIGYDRVGHWAAFPIRVGDRVTITRVVAEVPTRTGPVTALIDVGGEWLPAPEVQSRD